MSNDHCSERTLKKRIDHHVIEIIGEEQPYQQGRPRAVYRWNHHSFTAKSSRLLP